MKNFWFVVVSVIRSLFNNEIRTPRRVKGRCARVENLENRLALSASLPASDVALIREAFLEENVASLMGEYGSSSAGTMSAIDLSALIETAILDEDGAEMVFKQVLKGLEYHLVSEKEIEYRCYCSRERVEEAIRSIGPEELESIIAEGKDVSVSCQFCDKVYSFTPDELRALRQE